MAHPVVCPFRRCLQIGALALLAGATAAGAATVELVSKADPPGDRKGSFLAALNADGRYVVFQSDAPNVVPGQEDDNLFYDVFLHDRITGKSTLVTHAAGSPIRASNAEGDYQSLDADISADGRYVVFTSLGTELVPGAVDANSKSDVFLYDRLTDTTALVSHAAGEPGTPADGLSYGARISADGNYVVFTSYAKNLAAGQTEPTTFPRSEDVFLYQRSSGTVTLISRKSGSPATVGNGRSVAPLISADGGFVVFTSLATDLVAGLADMNTRDDVFVYQRSSGVVALVSRASGRPLLTSSGFSGLPAISPDGRWIAFLSHGVNLVSGQTDTAGTPDAFLFDRISGEMRLVSRTAASVKAAGGGVAGLAMSDDGRYVTFASTATKLVPGQVDTNGAHDVFVYDRVAGTTALVTRAPGTQATAAPSVQGAFGTDISADGRFIAFSSAAATLVPGQVDTNRTFDIFLHDRVARTTVLASHTRDSAGTAGNGNSAPPSLSADGKAIAFSSLATNIGTEPDGTEPDAPSTLFVYLRTTAEVAAVPLRDPNNPAVAADSWSSASGISADGRYVVFQSLASNLVPGQIDSTGSDPVFDPGSYDVFLRDQVSGKTVLVSHGSSSPLTTTGGFLPVLSADGKFAAYLAASGTSAAPPIGLRLYDRAAGSSILVNHAPGLPTQLEGSAFGPAISADGRFVAFQCRGCDLIPGQLDGNPGQGDDTDVFLFDRVTGVYTLVSHASGSLLTAGDRDSTQPAISADGRFVVFSSAATNLVAGQAGGGSTDQHIFVFDRTTGLVTLVTHASGAPTTAANGYTYPAGISADGRWIFFPSFATDLVPGQVDADGKSDVFLHDRVSGTTVLVSHSASSPTTAADGSSWPRSISADGRWLAFDSEAAGLVPGVSDTNRAYDVFLFDRVAGTTVLVSSAAGSPATTASQGGLASALSADGSRIAFFSISPDVVPGQSPPVDHTVLFLQELSTGARSILGPVRTANSSGSTGYLSTTPRMSDDGRKVAFTSDFPLIAGDFNDTWDVYFFDASGVPGGPVALTPCTLLDTRRAADRPVLRSNVQRSVTVRGACGVPATAKGVVVKATALASSGKGNLRFYPGAVTATPSGILRFEQGATRTEIFTLPLGPNGALTILPLVAGTGTVHAVVEVSGYFL